MKKPIYILGVNESHCATACLLKDGEVVACASEERFTGIKNQSGTPTNSINFCLKLAKIKPKDISAVNLSFLHNVSQKDNSSLAQTSENMQNIFNINPKISLFVFKFREFIYTNFFLKKVQIKHITEISKKLKIPVGKIHLIDHQTAHAYSSFYSFPRRFDKSVVITVDGSGDYVCSRIFSVINNKWNEIANTQNQNSLGLLYYYVTKYLRMKPNEHEYKVMGLAPYAKIEYSKPVLNIFKKIMSVKNLSIESKIPHTMFEKYLNENLRSFRFDQIASGIQIFTEQMLQELIENVVKKTRIRNIYAAGGVFMNVKANMLIANLPEVDNFYVVPSASDESTAIGAAYFSSVKPKPLTNIYLGPDVFKRDILKLLDKKLFIVKKMKNPAKVIAKLLKDGEIIARCTGRTEFGQRALGNRSILARADNRDVIKIINGQIKGRDFWMPFAPVILKERMGDYLINPKNLDSKYMMMAFDTTKLAQKELIAGLHPYDLTTRPQILSEKDNPEYYKILKEFEKLTGIGGILNTSFNLHGFPIVNTPQDAINTFQNSGLKYLVLGDYLVKKK